jgi:hypothetical protein
MKKLIYVASICLALVLCGCFAKVTVNKRPNVALPIYDSYSQMYYPTNKPVIVNYMILDQGYEVQYRKFGFNTDIQSMSAEITTNKTVNFQLGGLHSVSATTNNISIKLDEILKIAQLFRDSTNDVIVIDRQELK